MDSTALGALISLRNTADQFGKRLILNAIPPGVQRIIDITGLNAFLTDDTPAKLARSESASDERQESVLDPA